MQTLFDDKELKFFEPNYIFIDTNEKLKEHLDAITALNPVALDTETQGLDYFKDELLLLQLSDDTLSYVLDIRPGKVDLTPLVSYLEDPSVVKIGQNLGFDYSMLKVQRNIELKGMYCLMIAEQVITAGQDTTMSYKLEAICKRRLGIQLNKKVVSSFIGHPLELPFTKKQLDYAASDTLVLPEIFYQQQKAIEKHGLQKTIALEMACLGPLADTTIHGCNIDYDAWNLILDHSKDVEIRIANDIREILSTVSEQTSLFGTPVINLNSQKQLIKYLNKLGIPVMDTKSDTLEEVADMHPVIHMILEYREFEKIRSSYGDKLLNKKKKKTSRIHPSFHQCRAATGRMSSSTPNFQQIHRPKAFYKKLFEIFPTDPYYEEVQKVLEAYKDNGGALPSLHRETPDVDYSEKYFKLGRICSSLKYKTPNMDIYVDSTGIVYKYIPDFRECFTAPKGYKIVDADFSQCELRILAALSKDPKMLKVYREDGDIHTETAREIFGSTDKEHRDAAKPINFGIAYGQTSWGLSRLIGKPESYCKEILNRVKERFPVRARWLERTGEVSFEKGYSRTVIGRIRWLPMIIDPIKFPEEAERYRHALMRRGTNHEIQGTNADITKYALILMSRAFKKEGLDAHVVIVVHDEFVIEAREDQAERVARVTEECMAKAFNHLIPDISMPCEAKIADYWSK